MRWFMEKLNIPLPFFDWGSVYCNVSSTLAFFGYIKHPFALFEYELWFNFLTPPAFGKLIKSLSLFLSLCFHECLPACGHNSAGKCIFSFITNSFELQLSHIIFPELFHLQVFLLYECQNVKLPYNLNIYIFHIYPAVFTLAIHTIVRFECTVYNATSRAKLIKWLPRGLCVSVPMLFWRILIRPSMKLLPLNHKSLPHLQLAAHGYRWQLRTALEVLQQFNLLTEN